MTRKKKLYWINYLLIDALEGGSNYWYLLRKLPWRNEGETISESILRSLLQEGGKLEVYDIEDEDELLGTLTLDSMLEAFDLMEENWSTHYADILRDNVDASTADVWFQLAVMKDLVFG